MRGARLGDGPMGMAGACARWGAADLLHLRGQDLSAHVRWEGSQVSERVCAVHMRARGVARARGWPMGKAGAWA